MKVLGNSLGIALNETTLVTISIKTNQTVAQLNALIDQLCEKRMADLDVAARFIFDQLTVRIVKVQAVVQNIVFALIMLVLAVFVPRPYCRFVCPTGTLLKII